MPRARAARSVRRRESTPARWPATAGRWRAAAHRRFPSMMIARCRTRCSLKGSTLEDLALLRLADLFRLQDVTVVQLLELSEQPLHLIRRDAGVLLLLVELVRRVAAMGADLDARVLDL